tara:strand:+ start:292 stop:1065 length:774 start_codon:yes stop_codon:yes gene_type:complete
MINSLIKKQYINDLISIIMPAFNAGGYISYAIQSVINQTYSNWELIIIDNNSRDNTLEKVNKYLVINNRIKLFKSSENFGPGNARNIGLKKSKGTYIAFLDADDFWDSEFLEKLISFSKINNYYFVYCPYYICSGEISKLNQVSPYANISNILKANPLSCLAVLIKKNKIKYKFNTLFRTHEDIDMWIKIIKSNGVAYRYNKPLAFYRQRKNSLSSKKFKNALDRWVFLRNTMKYDLFLSIYFFLSYVIYGIKKYFF